MQRLLKEKLTKTEISEESIDSLEEKLVDFSVTLSQVEDKNLRNLLEFLFNYVVEKPNTTPWNKTIVKQFDLDPEDKTLRDDIRQFLYAVRIMKEISTEKERIEEVYRF